MLTEFPLMTGGSQRVGSVQTSTPTWYGSVGSKGPVTMAVDGLAAEEDTAVEDLILHNLLTLDQLFSHTDQVYYCLIKYQSA